MKFKHVGTNPICEAIQNNTAEFFNDGDYNPKCCRFPKSCSSNVYELFPESDVEQPKKLKVKRVKEFGPGTAFDWMVYGYHPTASGTITLLKYFSTAIDAHSFINNLTDWKTLLKNEGFLLDSGKILYLK